MQNTLKRLIKQRADVLTNSLGVSAWDSALKLLHMMSLKT